MKPYGIKLHFGSRKLLDELLGPNSKIKKTDVDAVLDEILFTEKYKPLKRKLA